MYIPTFRGTPQVACAAYPTLFSSPLAKHDSFSFLFLLHASMSNGSQDFWKDRRAPNIIIDSPRAKKETDEAIKKTGTSGFKPAGLNPPEASKPSDIKLKMDDTIKVRPSLHCTAIRPTMSVPHA